MEIALTENGYAQRQNSFPLFAIEASLWKEIGRFKRCKRGKEKFFISDLIPKKDVKGGHQSPFGVTDATNKLK